MSKKGGRGLTNIEDSVDASIQELEEHIKKMKKLITPASRRNGNISTSIKNNKKLKTKLGRKKLWIFQATNR